MVSVGKGSGYGKVILFGEHFVVYGLPGIASAVGLATDAVVTKSGALSVKDERKGTEGYSGSKREQQRESFERMFDMMGLKEKGVDIWLGGELPVMSGIGASAASSVAIARAVSDELKLGYDDAKINSVAYEMEKAFAGNPSGIDNTVATYGGLIWFKKNMAGGQNDMEKIRVPKPVEIVMGNSGVVADTKAMVAGVAERRKQQPEEYDAVFKKAEALAVKARAALEKGDYKTVGALMDENHSLLQQIKVSGEKLDELVAIAKQNGAFGAKVTGGGGGGCMVALTPGKELQERVASAMEAKGFQVLRTRIGV
ncbi:mevalonate kinase [Candidatus Micrarchaeota archaeon CG1_02_60_51]|nr:MAG: mevalonate kinase [Candidatus Micrarchaeota archaeon CG1_02_60_51]